MNHGKKMIAPIVIAVIIIAYYVGIAIVCATVTWLPIVFKVVMIVVPFIVAVVMLGTLISRIKEIKGGEEDDLSQY
ncbi:MAG: hypothetical protein NC313_12435 [Butyrivibrio sp.]|nr:hypothetical protein [Butyrivibrio sp.]